MLQQVVLETATPMTLNIDAVDPDEILVVKSISGLSPADLNLFTGEFARDGGYYQGRRTVKRNPVFTFKLNPNYTEDIEVSDIREILYQQFYMPQANSDSVQVRLVDDRKPDRYFIGYTEKLETDMWTRDQTAQVSMLCPDPYLRSVTETTASDLVGWASTPLTYLGSAGTGLEATIKVVGDTGGVNLDLNGAKMGLLGDFVVDDIIEINTNPGQRKITLNGVDIMAALVATSKWLELRIPDNTLKAYGMTEADPDAVIMDYTYRAAWWGI